MRFACSEVARKGYICIQLEGDNSAVIDAVLGNGPGSWEIDLVVADIRATFSRFQRVQISHVVREANAAADCVARLGHLM